MSLNIFNRHTHGAQALARYKEHLEALPPTGSGYHPALLGIANLGVTAGLSDDALFNDLREQTDERARRVPDSEIRQAIEKARKDSGTYNARDEAIKRKRKPAPKMHFPFTPATMKRRLIEAGKKYSETDLINASSMHLSGHPSDDSLCILDAFYSANEFLFIGTRFMKEVFRVAEFREMILSGRQGEVLPFMPHIIPNPLTGEANHTKDGKLSKRCDAAVKEYRFAIAEFDDMPPADQLAFWSACPLPIAALIDSGGKSIHAWIKLSDIFTPDDWQATIKETLYRDMLIPWGVDPACSNPARLSRLPGHYREEKGRWQRLLYINQRPNPKGIFRD